MPISKSHEHDASRRAGAPAPDERLLRLTAARNAKMSRSAHAYVRGNTARFYDWLECAERVVLPEGPPIWICGDCHIGNLGPVADVDGNLAVEIRDFDQTVVGNPAHDLVRLGLSLASAARSSDLPGVVTARMIEQLSEGYVAAFSSSTAARLSEQPVTVTQALRDAGRRTWRHLAEERVAGATRSLPLGKRFWPVSESERDGIVDLVQSDGVRALVTGLGHRKASAEVRMLDVAYWMKGCSSLGRLRYAVLLDVGGGAAKGRDLCLLDIKEAVTALAPHIRGDGTMPADSALRVVAGAGALSPFLGSRMHASRLVRRSVFMRELLPQDLKLEFERLSVDEATRAAYYLAHVVGTAHARQMDGATRRAWRRELRGSHSKVIDAPPWLWTGVVDLVASHERAYLDHCRRHALSADKPAASR